MDVKVARDVLDWRGAVKHETASAPVEYSGFDPETIVKAVVKSEKIRLSSMPKLKLERGAVAKAAARLGGGGAKFLWSGMGAVRIAACEHLPIGCQYLLYDRSGRRGYHDEKWIETDVDLTERT